MSKFANIKLKKEEALHTDLSSSLVISMIHLLDALSVKPWMINLINLERSKKLKSEVEIDIPIRERKLCIDLFFGDSGNILKAGRDT